LSVTGSTDADETLRTPIPVNLSRKDLKAELGRAINSTYFHPSTGTSK
jgi:ribosome biogenesis protein UTP30